LYTAAVLRGCTFLIICWCTPWASNLSGQNAGKTAAHHTAKWPTNKRSARGVDLGRPCGPQQTGWVVPAIVQSQSGFVYVSGTFSNGCNNKFTLRLRRSSEPYPDIDDCSPARSRYHMFASTFINGCNVWEWTSNSIITHAVSKKPLGPYTQRDCAMHTCAPEAHEGSVASAPTGETVLYFTSGPQGPGGSTPMDGGGHCDCSSQLALNKSCPFQCEAEVGCFAGHWNRSSQMATFMSFTPPHQPQGPWSKPVPYSG
jgi:hypothetical protein